MGPESNTPGEGRPSDPIIDVQLRPQDEPAFAAVLSLRGEHDLATATAIADALAEIEGSVLVDLSDCTFIDSTVIGVLFASSHELERAGRCLELVLPRANVSIVRTLELVRMRDVMVVHDVRPSREPGSSTGT